MARDARPGLQYGDLSNPAASREARKLYGWLCRQYGHKTLTGQQESTWDGGPRNELDYLLRVTGRQPAILGLDYIDPDDRQGVNERAAQWYRAGGIATICWHWGAPDKGPGYENSKQPFDLEAAFRPGTPQHAALWRDLSEIADCLTVLRDQRVPVLWRPLHEFTGTWFWWGQWGPKGFRRLWNLMYRYFTRTRRLDNLIWVLGFADHPDARYWPGRTQVDIAGMDTYVDHPGNLSAGFQAVKAIVGGSVPICLHENGPIPLPEGLGRDADWLYFMTWHTRWLKDPDMNPPQRVRAAYNSGRYLTLDELARF